MQVFTSRLHARNEVFVFCFGKEKQLTEMQSSTVTDTELPEAAVQLVNHVQDVIFEEKNWEEGYDVRLVTALNSLWIEAKGNGTKFLFQLPHLTGRHNESIHWWKRR